MYDTSEEWAEKTAHAAMEECDSTAVKMVGAVCLGCALAAFNVVLGVVVAIPAIAWLQKRQWDSCDRAEYAIVHNGGAVAAKGKNLKSYLGCFWQRGVCGTTTPCCKERGADQSCGVGIARRILRGRPG